MITPIFKHAFAFHCVFAASSVLLGNHFVELVLKNYLAWQKNSFVINIIIFFVAVFIFMNKINTKNIFYGIAVLLINKPSKAMIYSQFRAA